VVEATNASRIRRMRGESVRRLALAARVRAAVFLEPEAVPDVLPGEVFCVAAFDVEAFVLGVLVFDAAVFDVKVFDVADFDFAACD
jgi:hypothetical protein